MGSPAARCTDGASVITECQALENLPFQQGSEQGQLCRTTRQVGSAYCQVRRQAQLMQAPPALPARHLCCDKGLSCVQGSSFVRRPPKGRHSCLCCQPGPRQRTCPSLSQSPRCQSLTRNLSLLGSRCAALARHLGSGLHNEGTDSNRVAAERQISGIAAAVMNSLGRDARR